MDPLFPKLCTVLNFKVLTSILAFNVRSPASKVQSPGFRVQSPVSRVQRPASSVQSPESSVQSLASSFQSPASRVQSSVSRTQRPESRVQGPESSVHLLLSESRNSGRSSLLILLNIMKLLPSIMYSGQILQRLSTQLKCPFYCPISSYYYY